jgi:kynurenine formamidase
MKTRKILAVSVAGLLLSSSMALAGQPDGNRWGKWGPDDELGALNYITPAKIAKAATLVRTGKVFNLALDLQPNTPGWTGRTYRHTFDFIFNPSGEGLGAADDAIAMHQQYSTQWDGFGHFFFNGKMFNGHEVSEHLTVAGATKNSIHNWAESVVGRGVLLDVARYKGVDNLEKGYIITPADLMATARSQNVRIESGDMLLIRTGWISVLREHPWPMRGNEPVEFGEPGIGLQAVHWMKDREIAAIAFDSMAGEAMPFDPEALDKVIDAGDFKGFPVHVELLVNQGIPLGEIWDFDALAKDCAADGVYEFMLVAPPLRIVGGIGSPLSPLAIK